MKMEVSDLIVDLRSRINPAYANQIGTESWERKLCADALEAQADEIDRLNLDREALMRRLFMAGEVFAEIEAHPERAERLARDALFGPGAEPLRPNAQLQGPGGSLPGPAASDS